MKTQTVSDSFATTCRLAATRKFTLPVISQKTWPWLLGALLLPLLGLVAGCANPSPQPWANSWSSLPAGAHSFTNLCLQEGDVVRISFEGSSNLNSVVKLQLDGTINLPLIGDVKALRRTPQELQADLTKLYTNLLKPGFEITVGVASTSASVYVTGAVLRPGRIAMERPLTVLEAIMEAGGFDLNRAKPSKVVVFRVANGLQRNYRLDLKRMMKGEDSGVFYLKPFDIIHVPEKTFNF